MRATLTLSSTPVFSISSKKRQTVDNSRHGICACSPTLWRLRQEDKEAQPSLVYTRLFEDKTKNNKEVTVSR